MLAWFFIFHTAIVKFLAPSPHLSLCILFSSEAIFFCAKLRLAVKSSLAQPRLYIGRHDYDAAQFSMVDG